MLDNGNIHRENFVIGNKTYSLSPTTIRYLGYVGMMKNILEKSKEVIEIGGGYGGQAQIILLLYPNISHYQIIDLEEVVLLQKDYLSTFLPKELGDKMIFNKECRKYDLLIANYSLAELPFQIVQEYMKYLHASNSGFIIWNTTNYIPKELKNFPNYNQVINEPDFRGSEWKNIYKITYNQEQTSEISYDEIVSLGYNCYVPEVMKKLNVRNIAYPFDWITTNLSFIEQCIINPNNFSLLSPNEIEYIKFFENHYYYTNKEKTIVSLHDFKSEDKNAPINLEVYEKFKRRVARFENILHSNKKILFIRLAKFPYDSGKDMGINPESETPEKIGKLADLITKLYPQLNFKILFCCDRGDVDNKVVIYSHPKVYSYVRYMCEIIDHHLYEKLSEILAKKEKVIENPKEIVKGRVSVIIPTYNRGEELKRAVSSVINNTYPNVEVIVVDDCSTNEISKKIINDLKFQNICVLKTKTNSGNPAVPRNIGIQHASGEWIAFLDDDDEFLPEKLEEQILAMKEKKSLFSCSDAYYSKTTNYYDKDNTYAVYHSGLYTEIMKKTFGTNKFPEILNKQQIIDHNWIMTSGVIIHHSIIEKTGTFVPAKETKEGWEDYNYWLRVLDHTNILMINKPLIFYNMTPRVEKKWHQF